ncbi:uncharacterized protein LOC113327547 [Papaver somniferum]|uniref:uncharacterized protein LOC113327547 n=1 Tax=Papaver somniferum TaxID=3469 RepID=UPI000E702345|nr:uncharacterized protein LOC113327547 [Papaver somniferum]
MVVFNQKWMQKYEDWGYKVGLKIVSDHSPLLGGCANIPKPQNVSRKFQKMWISHPDFLNVVKESWSAEVNGDPAFIFMKKLKELKRILNDWNWRVFGNVHVKLKEAENKDSDGNVISDQKQIAECLVNHFQKKFEEQSVTVKEELLEAVPQLIDEEDQKYLDEIFSIEEIKKTVFDMDPESSPGPDGFSGFFYRSCWEIIQQDLLAAIQFCWRRRFIPKGMNYSFLVLLPKTQGARSANQFRPIGLSYVLFKIFTKIITTRMSSLMVKLISPQQFAYIKGRSIQEQVMLASELVNEMKIKRRGGNVGLKLDISQAYDSVSWEFLMKVLRKYGFSSSWCDWLIALFQSAKISVLVNGGPSGFFSVGRGLRKGDLLSHILFVLMEDVLSINISKLVEMGKILPMVIRNGVHPTHLFFADDVFMFCNGAKKSLKNLLSLLDDYQISSGQVINKSKSKCFVDGVSNARKQQISEVVNMDLSHFPDKYLGVILAPGRVTSSMVWPMLEQLQRKLAAWKGKLL